MASTTEQMQLSNGQTECRVIQDTTEYEGGWRLIHVIEEATVTVLVNTLTDDTYVGLTLPVGAVLGGNFTNIKLASGAVIAYS
jgi:hypothetical protein